MSGRQRERIVEAMALVVYERGFADASVGAICTRAKVSRRTFYLSFQGRRDCFLALLENGHRQASVLIAQAFARARQEEDRDAATLAGLRGALAELLCFFDEHPELTRAWLVESLAAGAWALERRERHVAALVEQIAEHCGVAVESGPGRLTALGAMASVFGLIQRQLVIDGSAPLIVLLGPLIGAVTAPYLDAPAVVVQVECAEALARELLATRSAPPAQDASHISGPGAEEHAEGVPAALCNPQAHRARACLLHLAEHPGASNAEVARAVGIASHTQASTLLTRLMGMGMLDKRAGRPGHANAWSLTPHGRQVAQALRLAARSDPDLSARVQRTSG